MIPGFPNRKRFSELTDQEILALAISSEEEDGRIYATYAEKLRPNYPQSAQVFEGMAAEEDTHRRRLIEIYAAVSANLPVSAASLSALFAPPYCCRNIAGWSATMEG